MEEVWVQCEPLLVNRVKSGISERESHVVVVVVVLVLVVGGGGPESSLVCGVSRRAGCDRGVHQCLRNDWLNDLVLRSPASQQWGLTHVRPRHSSVCLFFKLCLLSFCREKRERDSEDH